METLRKKYVRSADSHSPRCNGRGQCSEIVEGGLQALAEQDSLKLLLVGNREILKNSLPESTTVNA